MRRFNLGRYPPAHPEPPAKRPLARRGAGAGLARAWRVGVLVVLLAVTGCGLFGGDEDEPPPEPPPPPAVEVPMPPPGDARLEVVVTASPLVNPDLNGRPSPVVVRIYQLNAPDPFSQADFFQLYEKDAETLGGTALGRRELILQPAGVQSIAAARNAEATHVGVTAGYRKYDEAQWRAITPLPGDRDARVRVVLESLKVEVTGQWGQYWNPKRPNEMPQAGGINPNADDDPQIPNVGAEDVKTTVDTGRAAADAPDTLEDLNTLQRDFF